MLISNLVTIEVASICSSTAITADNKINNANLELSSTVNKYATPLDNIVNTGLLETQPQLTCKSSIAVNTHCNIEAINDYINSYAGADVVILNDISRVTANTINNGHINITATDNHFEISSTWQSYYVNADISIDYNSTTLDVSSWTTGESEFNINNYINIDAQPYIQTTTTVVYLNIKAGGIVTNPNLDAFWVPRGITERLIFVSNNSITFIGTGATFHTHNNNINGSELIHIT